MKSIDNKTKDRILSLLQARGSINNVSRATGVGKATVSRLKKSFLSTLPNQASGRPRILSATALRKINRNVLTGDCKTGKAVYKQLRQEGVQISYRTTLNNLRHIGIQPRRRAKKPFLSKKHREERMRWARTHQHWTVDDWRRVIFSDETKINLWNSDGIKYSLRKQDTPLQPFHIEETVKHGGGSLMFWGCMTSKGLGYGCQIYDGTMKAVDYIHILDTTLKDSLEYYGYNPDGVIFQHDNDRKHTATVTKTYLEDERIKVLPWPSQSADLNPIEHVWNYLKVRIGLRDKRPTSIRDLWQVVLEEWEKIPTQYIQSLYTSMPSRVKAVLKAKGRQTRY